MVHITYYAISNSGDTVLSKCVRKTVDVLEHCKRWEIINVSKKVNRKYINRINKTAGIIIGGGGLFLPDTNKNKISGWQWAISREQLEQIKVPIIVYSVGYNYFRGQAAEELFKENLGYIVNKADFVGLRNQGSVVAVRKLLGDDIGNKVVYQPCTTTLIRKIYEKELPEKRETGVIGFNMAFDREKFRYGEKKEEILTQVASAVRQIEKRGYRIVYIMHCKEDDRFIPYLKEKGVRFEVVDTSLWYPRRIMEFYNGVDFVMGMRGHAQMIPFGLNCGIISLGAHDKMKWFLEDIDAMDWYEELTFETSKLTNRLVNRFISVHEINKELTAKRLISQQDKLWKITLGNWKKIERSINM